MNNTLKKIIVSAMIFSFAFAFIGPVVPTTAVEPPAPDPTIEELLATIAALNATIAELNATIAELRAVPDPDPAVAIEGVPAGFTFNRNLRTGMSGDDVRYLQIILNADEATQVAATGVGSAGNETKFFGPLTHAAVVRFQNKHAAEVLGPVGLTVGTGFVGPSTREKLNDLLVVPDPIIPDPVPADFDNEADCVAANFYWWDDACHAEAKPVPADPIIPDPVPADFDNEADCVAANFYWWDDACHAEAKVVPADPVAEISPYTLAATDLPRNAQMVPVLTVDITAGLEELTISEMTFRRIGVGAADDWLSLYLFEGDIRLTDFGRTISADTHEVSFPALGITIPAGETKSYTLRVDVGEALGVGAFELIDITSNIAITGLPIAGNLMEIRGVKVEPVTIIRRAVVDTEPMVGAQDVEIAAFRIVASDNAVAVEQIAIEVTGRGNVANLELYHGADLLASTPAVGARNKAVFVLDPAFVIDRNVGRNFVVKADVSGRAGERPDTIVTRIEDPEDVIVIDQALGFGAGNDIDTAAPDGLDLQVAPNHIVLKGGTLTLVDLGPTATDIAADAKDVVLTKVAMTADRNLEVRELRVRIETLTAITPEGKEVTDLRIKDADTGATLMGPVATPGDTELMSGVFTLTAGQTRNIVITVDTDADITGGIINADLVLHENDFTATVRDLATGDNLTSDDFVPAIISGDNQTIVPARLTIALSPFPDDDTVVAGVADVEAVGFRLRAKGENVIIRNIEAQVYADTTEDNLTAGNSEDRNLANDIVILARLMDGATVLDTATLTTTGLARFTGINLPIAVDESKDLVVQISTVATLPDDDTHYVAVAIDTAEIDAEDVDGNPVNATGIINAVSGTDTPRITTVNPSGALALGAIDPATPEAAIIPVGDAVIGATNVAVTRVRFEANYEPIILERINVQNVGRVAADGNATSTPRTVEIWTDGAMVADEIFDANGLANFIGLDIEVPTVGRRVLDIKVDLGGIGHGSESGDTVELNVDVERARGKYSGTLLDDDDGTRGMTLIAGGNPLTIRQTVPTVTKLANQTVLTGANDEVLKFTVTADSAGDVELRNLKVTFTGTATTTRARLYEGGTRLDDGELTNNVALFDLVTPARTERHIAAGASRTFTVKACTGTITSGATLLASIAADTEAAATGNFVWKDGSTPADTINGYLVDDLPITGNTLVKP